MPQKPSTPKGNEGFATPYFDGRPLDLSSTDWNAADAANETVTKNQKDVFPRGFCVQTDGLVQLITAEGTTLIRYCLKGNDYPCLVKSVLRSGTDAALRVAGQIIVWY